MVKLKKLQVVSLAVVASAALFAAGCEMNPAGEGIGTVTQADTGSVTLQADPGLTGTYMVQRDGIDQAPITYPGSVSIPKTGSYMVITLQGEPAAIVRPIGPDTFNVCLP
jgi:hypothetical protein